MIREICKKTLIVYFALVVAAMNAAFGAGTPFHRHVEATPTKTVTKASFDFRLTRKAKAVLALVPGANGEGRGFLNDTNWTAFAEQQNWAVVAASFVSPVELLKKNSGYYDVAKDSGRMLLDSLAKANLDGLPIFVFGFSGGARYAAGLAMSYPDSVAGWAAHAPSDAVKISKGVVPPGIVACGEDDVRLGATLSWFKDLCAKGGCVTWVEIPRAAHVRSGKFEAFVRKWFVEESARRASKKKGLWCDLGNGEVVDSSTVCAKANQSWFPSRAAYDDWRNLVADMTRRIELRRVNTQAKGSPTLTLFCMRPHAATNVLCLSLLAHRPSDVGWMLRKRSRKGTVGCFLDYAENHNMAVVAWGAPRGLWKPRFNWDDLRQDENRHISRSFGYAANGWCKAMDGLAADFGLPRSGYYMAGISGAAQFAQRLALHAPERFKAVAIHISSSYDYPLPAARDILWCYDRRERTWIRKVVAFPQRGEGKWIQSRLQSISRSWAFRFTLGMCTGHGLLFLRGRYWRW